VWAKPADVAVRDTLGAFCAHASLRIEGARGGPLAGLTFAAKDLFDVAGYACCFGNPDWLRTHAPARRSAPAVRMLLAAGATLVGKTLTDELAFSLAGENIHYGTPLNPRAPERTCGGSSCGSASAVAGALVDFALGTDTSGSVRVPAAFCGLYGMRPSHGRVPTEGVIAHVPSADTVGWMARDAEMLGRVGEAMLAERIVNAAPPRRLLIADDAFSRATPQARKVLAALLARVARAAGTAEHVTLAPDGLDQWVKTYLAIQNPSVWAARSDWVLSFKPDLSEPLRERLAVAARATPRELAAAEKERAAIRHRLDTMLAGGAILCLPTTPDIAPLRARGSSRAQREAILSLTCIASLCGLPQVNLPMSELKGCPLGLGLIAARGADTTLLALAAKIKRPPEPQRFTSRDALPARGRRMRRS